MVLHALCLVQNIEEMIVRSGTHVPATQKLLLDLLNFPELE